MYTTIIDPVTGAEIAHDPSVEIDVITGQPIKRDAMGNILDPQTGLPKDASGHIKDPVTGEVRDPQTGQTKEQPETDKAKDAKSADDTGTPLHPHHPHASQHRVVEAELARIDELAMSLPHDSRGIAIEEALVEKKVENPNATTVADMLATAADHQHVAGLTGMVEAETLEGIRGLEAAKHLVLSSESLPAEFGASDIGEMMLAGPAAQKAKQYKEMQLQQHTEKVKTLAELPPLSSKNG